MKFVQQIENCAHRLGAICRRAELCQFPLCWGSSLRHSLGQNTADWAVLWSREMCSLTGPVAGRVGGQHRASCGRRQGVCLCVSLLVSPSSHRATKVSHGGCTMRILANPDHLPEAPTTEHRGGSCSYSLIPLARDYISTHEPLAGTLKSSPHRHTIYHPSDRSYL